MKKIISAALVLSLLLTYLLCLASCGKKGITIAIPNDATNEARALALLETKGIITVKKNLAAGTTATVNDIESNPYNVKFKEVEAAQLPSVLADVDYAVINSNYALAASLTPFTTEGTDVSFPNIIAVKSGCEENDNIKALVAAVNSAKVKEYIENTYKGAIVCDLENVTDGTDSTVDYEALKGTTISIAASPTPHCDILAVAKEILAEKDITLDIKEFTDYVQPNMVVEDGEMDANFFQHIPYLDDFNAENGTHIVSVLKVHHEPMGIYSNTYTSLDAITASAK